MYFLAVLLALNDLSLRNIHSSPELARVINNVQSLSPDRVYALDVLNVFSHAQDTHERKVLNENEWFGWVQWMRACFRLGTIKEHWKQIHGLFIANNSRTHTLVSERSILMQS